MWHPLTQIPWDSLTTRIAATRNLTSKPLNRQRSSSSQLASARAVMFKRPHLPCQQKQTKARTCLSKGRHFEIFNFGQSYERAGFGGDLGTYLLPIPFVRVPLQEHQVRPIFYDLDLSRIWTNWCGSLWFLCPRERTRFNKKPLKWAFS